jgi:hypothetical protein
VTIPVSQSVLSSRACYMRAVFLTIAFVPVTADAVFSGITTFAKLPWVQCLTKEKHVPFDIAFLGAPFVSFRHIPPPCSALTADGVALHRTPARRTGREHGSDPLAYARDRAA